MDKATARITNAREFDGPPTIAALRESGLQLVAHDVSVSGCVKMHKNYRLLFGFNE